MTQVAPEPSSTLAGPGQGTAPARTPLRKILDSPVCGFVPWILLSILEGPGRLELAAGLALGLSAVLFAAGRLAGTRTKILEVVDLVSFAAFLVLAITATPGVKHWLELWFGEMSNLLLVLVVVVSMLVRVPFTIQYAKEQTDPSVWSSPLFQRINYVVTGAWGVAFLISAIAGYVGDGILHSNDNIWTGWVIQIAAQLCAVQFTVWYPPRARAIARRKLGVPTDPPPSVAAFVLGLAGYLVPIGILLMVFGSAPTWVGIAVIAAGVFAGMQLRRSEAPTG
jgi:hypothetical protein